MMETRVRAVVDTSIMVHIHDVVPGDIVYIRGNEKDPIIDRVERREDGWVRLHYKVAGVQPDVFDVNGKTWVLHPIKMSQWMNPSPSRTGNGCMFIHDLKRERDLYEGEERFGA